MMRISFLIATILLALFASPAFCTETAADEMGHISGEIFEKKSRWCHAYLSLSEAYDDNIFNTSEMTESDYITVISPGIQLTLPGTEQTAEEIVTGPNTPGGLVFGRFSGHSFQRVKVYLGYAPWLQFYADHEDENVINHSAQAGFQFNLKNGIAFDAANRFDKNYDRNEAGTSTQTDSYYSNLFILSASYPFTNKLRLQADYTNFRVTYSDDDKNGFRDRKDNSGSGYLFFEFKPKTAVYIKYQYTGLDYENDNDRNSEEKNYLGGIKWDFTSKTNFNLQAGYGARRYENSSFDESDSFVCRLDLNYQLSPKTDITVNIYHRNEESSVSAYDYTRTMAASLKFTQTLTHKTDFELDVSYRNYDYKAEAAELTGVPDRSDNHFRLTPSLTYAIARWLSVSLAYSYRNRDSDIESYGYTGNTVMLKITGSI